MNKYELLDLIGEAGEQYVLAADTNVVRPRFRWKSLAVCAACAALVAVAAYPHVLPNAAPAGGVGSDSTADAAPMAPEAAPAEGEEAASSGTVVQRPGLHGYTLIEEELRIMTTQGGAKAPGNDAGAPAPNPDLPMPDQGAGQNRFSGEAFKDEAVDAAPPAYSSQEGLIQQDEASAQYDRLLQWMGGVDGQEPAAYPEWFAGMWLDSDWPDNTARLTVAVVDRFRTEELEEQIRTQAGGTGDVLFCGGKYSQNELNGLMDQIAQVFEELDVRISSVYGVYVMDNYLGLDFFGAMGASSSPASGRRAPSRMRRSLSPPP